MNGKKVRVKRIEGSGQGMEVFREVRLIYATEVYGMQKVDSEHVRKGSEWWDEKVMMPVKKKRKVYMNYLLRRGGNIESCARESGNRSRKCYSILFHISDACSL